MIGRGASHGVDVVDVVADPVGGEGVLVERQVVGSRGARARVRRGGGGAGAVLGGQDQDVGVVGVLDDLERDVVGGLAAAA